MHASLLTVASFGAVALAVLVPEIEKRQNPSVASIVAEISSLNAELQPPPSIAAELTGVPASVTAALGNPSAIAALESQFIAEGPPAWYTALPANAQSYVLAEAALAQSILPEIASLEVQAGLTTPPLGATSTAGSGGVASTTATVTSTSTSATGTVLTTATTGGSNSTLSTKTSGSGSASGSKASGSGSASGSGAAGVSTTKAASGAAPTGVIAAGLLGAVGFVGMAFAL